MNEIKLNPGMSVRYLGSLRCEGKHLRSGNILITDAPPDNNGRGEAFSPTDLLCTSLACCMITVMGIAAVQKGIAMGDVRADIEKVMDNHPRRVVAIRIRMEIGGENLTEKDREILRNTALTCPVARSLHPDLSQEIDIRFV